MSEGRAHTHRVNLWCSTWPLVAAVLAMTVTLAGQTPSPTPAPTIDRKAAALDGLIAPDASFEKLADGFAWVEGPVWSRTGDYRLFSDIPNNVVEQWKKGSPVREFLRPSGYDGTAAFTGREPGSNGLTFDHEDPALSSASTATAASPASRRTARSRRWRTTTRASA